MRTAISLGLALVLCCGWAPGVLAQRVTGVVRDSATGGFIPGAVVTLTDGSGKSLARTLSDANGRYTLAAQTEGIAIRVIRIGFRPNSLRVGNAMASPLTLDIPLARNPALLAPMDVVSKAICPEAPDRRDAAALWEQARAGLLASVVAREARPARATIYGYDRVMDPRSRRISMQRARVQYGNTTRPFVSPDAPGILAERGYVEDDASGRLYKAPDADVLLDESFAETHCFGIARGDSANAGAVGLTFEPARGRESLVDVRGVLWLDAAEPALRSMEFRFTGLEPAAVRARAGGDMRFRTMRNGVAFIDRWRMLMPVLVASDRAARPPEPRRSREGLRLQQLSESGGYVIDAIWDALAYRSPLEPLTGRVVESGSERPLAGVAVALEGTADSASTDSTGTFTFHPVIPGHYTLVATDTVFAQFAKARAEKTEIFVGDAGPTSVRIQMPPRAATTSRLCDGHATPEGTSILFGTLKGTAFTPPGDLSVVGEWFGTMATTGNRTIVMTRRQESTVDDAGKFRLCGAPALGTVRLAVNRGGSKVADTTFVVPRNQPAVRVDWEITRRP